MTQIEIDGSQGEGGGQILRSALALSIITQQPFRIQRIRAGRAKPGLLRQHLTAVQAAQAISHAQVRGAALRSESLTFQPQQVKAGAYHFSIGTAGSTSLVLQTILYPLLYAEGPSKVTIEGGTHNDFAPPFDYLTQVLFPLLRKMGIHITATLERYGFYPQGGGRVIFKITPAKTLTPLTLSTCPTFKHAVEVVHSAASPHFVKQAFANARKRMGWTDAPLVETALPSRTGAGQVLYLRFESDSHDELFAGFGGPHVSAEKMVGSAAQEALRFLAAQVPVGPHLADQLLLPMALVGQGGFLSQKPTAHTQTNRLMIQTFLDINMSVENVGKDQCAVRVW